MKKRDLAIYVVPDNYLVKQVIDEAKRLGISATVDKDDYNYSNSKAILVTSIQTIVNGHSLFRHERSRKLSYREHYY